MTPTQAHEDASNPGTDEGALLAPEKLVGHGNRTPPNELASAAIFVLGCVGLCGMLIWSGPDGFAPGYVLFGLGWVIAMDVEDRFRCRSSSTDASARRS